MKIHEAAEQVLERNDRTMHVRDLRHRIDESVWNYVKHRHVGKANITGPVQFRALVFRILRRLQKIPALVKSFFGQCEVGDPQLTTAVTGPIAGPH